MRYCNFGVSWLTRAKTFASLQLRGHVCGGLALRGLQPRAGGHAARLAPRNMRGNVYICVYVYRLTLLCASCLTAAHIIVFNGAEPIICRVRNGCEQILGTRANLDSFEQVNFHVVRQGRLPLPQKIMAKWLSSDTGACEDAADGEGIKSTSLLSVCVLRFSAARGECRTEEVTFGIEYGPSRVLTRAPPCPFRHRRGLLNSVRWHQALSRGL